MTPPPKGEARLGSPFGRAGTAAAVTERASCQRPHTSVSPRRRLWRSSPVGSALRRPNRQVRTQGGTRLGRGDRKARRKPPWHRRCHQGSRLPPRSALNGAHRAPAPPGEGFLRKTVHWTIFLFSCACWRYKTVGRCPTPCQLSFEKAGQRTLPAYGAHVRWPLDEHERSELPKARLAWGATPAHVR